MAEKNETEKKNITVFGEETEFDGVLEFKDRLVITGKFSGKINAPEGDLEIAKNAVCKVDKIDANTTDPISHAYKLYMWIGSGVRIGEVNADYTPAVWNDDIFASIKVSVNGDFGEKTLD